MTYCLRRKDTSPEWAYWGSLPGAGSGWFSSARRSKYSAAYARIHAEKLAKEYCVDIEICLPKMLEPGYEVKETVSWNDRNRKVDPFERPGGDVARLAAETSVACTMAFIQTQPREVSLADRNWSGDTPCPEYYKIVLDDGTKVTPFDIIEACGMNFNLGCVVKYILRAGRKHPDKLDDLKKARNCIDREIKRLSPKK